MTAWSIPVLVLLAPLALGGLVQLVLIGPIPGTALAVIAWLGVAGAVTRILKEHRELAVGHRDDQ